MTEKKRYIRIKRLNLFIRRLILMMIEENNKQTKEMKQDDQRKNIRLFRSSYQ